MNDLHEYSTILVFHEENKNIVRTQDSIRWQIRHRDQNGLAKAKAVVKRQGRWYIHTGRYANWMANGND